MLETDSIFFERMSKRSFLDRPVEEEKLQELFEIIRWSPSSGNNQPWRFVFVDEPERKAKFLTGLSRGNQWAGAAPFLIAVCGRPQDDGIREDDPVQYYQFACGMATMSLLLGAVSLGLLAHPMGGYDAHKVKAALDIPSEYHVMTVIAMGYKGPIEQLDERTRAKDEAPRVRKPITDIIARNVWTLSKP